MCSKIACGEIVFEIVEWCNRRMGEQIGPGDRVIGVEVCV